ncbi:MAG: isochorismatase family protein [Candidatus Heimdallarchaeota archaeon]|nr:isochorismatase family protein [Candidatus Heimdallarchaeota archaeon]
MLKEVYLTEQNRVEKVKYWLDECKKVKTHRPYELNLKKAALLILDMQDYFIDKKSHAFVPSSLNIISQIQEIAKIFRRMGSKVLFSMHIDTDDEDSTMNRWWKGSIKPNSDLSKITHSLNKQTIEVIEKSQYSAFYETELEAILKENDVEQVIITGVMTHLCCETTARDAFMRGFEVFFVVDATATYTEELHLGTLRAISHGFGTCISTGEIINEE